MEKYYGKPTPNSFSDIVDQYSTKAINSITTSTVPFLNYWKNAEERMPSFLSGLGILSTARTIAFEYPTRSYGTNKASMTDLMVFCDDWRIAIEAKFREIEHRYETIAEWNKERTENRSRVISHWLEMLSPFVDAVLEEDSIGDIPYQFLHRIASSCEAKHGNASTIYQLFYDKNTEPRIDAFIKILASAAKRLEPRSKLKVWVLKVATELLRPNTDKETVLQTLKTDDLYSFGEEQFLQLVP